jgi:hypothetical protein
VHDVSLKSEDVEISESEGSQRGGVDKNSEKVQGGLAALFKGFLRGFVGVAVHGFSLSKKDSWNWFIEVGQGFARFSVVRFTRFNCLRFGFKFANFDQREIIAFV